MKNVLFLFLVIFSSICYAQQQTIEIWNGKAPGAIATEGYAEQPKLENGRLNSTSQVTHPTLEVFLAKENPTQTGV